MEIFSINGFVYSIEREKIMRGTFVSLLTGSIPPIRNGAGHIVLNRDPYIFGLLIEYLETGVASINSKEELMALQEEMDFWLLSKKPGHLDSEETIERKWTVMEEIKRKMSKMLLEDEKFTHDVLINYSNMRNKLVCEDQTSNSYWSLARSRDLNLLYCKLQARPAYEHCIITGGDLVINGINVGIWGNPDLELLKSMATPAPFGRGSETVYSDDVRKALQIPIDSVKQIWFLNGHPCGTPCGTNIIFKPYKIHIYEAGGFFVEHTDTVHAKNHVATMIVPLNNEYEGGQLIVYSPDKRAEKTFDMRIEPSAQDGILVKANAAVFYTDCPHVVEPVTQGTRVVMQFDGYLETYGDYEDEDEGEDTDFANINPNDSWFDCEEDDREDDREDQDVRSLIDPLRAHIAEAHLDGVALLLHHGYIQDEVSPNDLKGIDYKIWQTLSQHFDHELTRVLIEFISESEYNDMTGTIRIYPCMVSDLLEKPNLSAQGQIHVLPGSKGNSLLTLHQVDFVEYTGNEAQQANLKYASVALVLRPKK